MPIPKGLNRHKILLALAYKSFRDYCRLVTPEWQDAAHIDYLCGLAESVVDRRCRRLIVNIPPGYAKSWIFSRCLPSWFLMKYPKREFMLISYGDDLAQEHSSAARQMFSYWAPEIVGHGIAKDSKSVVRWMVEMDASNRGGGMLACGVGSAVTGRRADLIVIDDPYKNWDDASSESARDRVWNFYRSVIRSRLRPGGCIVVIQTRWHKDDLTGRLVSSMSSGGMFWEVCKLPARAVEGDLLGREVGAALWPGMYNEGELLEARGDIGDFFWSCQYQQDPEEIEGKVFKGDWFRYFDEVGGYFVLHSPVGDITYGRHECLRVQTVDPAATEDERNDFFCSAIWDLCPRGEILLQHVYREHIATTDHVDEVGRLFDLWRPSYILLSKKSHGMNLFQELEMEGYPMEEIKEDVSKLSRAASILRKYRKSMVYHLAGASWSRVVENELKEFPGGHDDFVDNASAIGIESVRLGDCGLLDLPKVGGMERIGHGLGLYDSELR